MTSQWYASCKENKTDRKTKWNINGSGYLQKCFHYSSPPSPLCSGVQPCLTQSTCLRGKRSHSCFRLGLWLSLYLFTRDWFRNCHMTQSVPISIKERFAADYGKNASSIIWDFSVFFSLLGGPVISYPASVGSPINQREKNRELKT